MVMHLWWLGVAFVSVSEWAQADGANKPVVKVGDESVYTVDLRGDKRTTEERVTVTSVDQTHIRSKHVRPDRQPPDIEGVVTLDWATVVSGTSDARYDPPHMAFKFPLIVGNSWASRSVVEGGGNKSRTDLALKVVARETVKTPAGEFDAFKIESEGWINGISWTGAIRTTEVRWYAPAIGRVVRTEYQDFRGGRLWTDTVLELKSFKSAP